MSRVKVRARFDVLKILNENFGREFQQELGDTLVEEMKNDISKGNSPIRGERRLERYKDPKKYPGDRKLARPVNIELSGEMLSYLKAKSISGRSAVEVGILDAPASVQARAAAHNTGTDALPQRKFLPWEDGDELSVRITRVMIDKIKEGLARLIKKSNT